MNDKNSLSICWFNFYISHRFHSRQFFPIPRNYRNFGVFNISNNFSVADNLQVTDSKFLLM